MEFRQDPIERRSDEEHRRIAARIRQDPSIIAAARSNLERWMKREPDPEPVLIDWQAVLELMSPEEVATFLESSTPRARRMRISTPFVGSAR